MELCDISFFFYVYADITISSDNFLFYYEVYLFDNFVYYDKNCSNGHFQFYYVIWRKYLTVLFFVSND